MEHPPALPPWELRHLRAFIAVIEHQSFTRAAESLWVSQPSLSRTIAQMEHQVGQRLIIRDNGMERLTEAGVRLEPYARRVLAAAGDAFAAIESFCPILRIGFTWNALGEDTGDLISEFEAAHPKTSVRLSRCDDDPLGGLADGRSDLALLRGTPPPAKVAHIVLRSEPRVAVLPSDHKLADQPHVGLADLGHETLVINVPTGSTPTALWGHHCAQRDIIKVHNIDEWLEAIAGGQGVGVSASSTRDLRPHPRVVYRPLPEAPSVPVVLAWTLSHAHPLAAQFIDTARRMSTAQASVCDRC
ncbi:MAG: LysR family transcriptional regulator [Streptomycetaceae bacterium]|nr:LysR family transcriptional regulator [Streptomycetaceae bacterium]